MTGGGQEEIWANCQKSTPTFDVGRNVFTDNIYKPAYFYENNAWVSYTLSSSGSLISNNWYPSFASVAIPSQDLSSFNWTYAVGYVCAWSGTQWKCGCADVSCPTS